MWTRDQLSEEDRKWLRDLRYVRLIDHFSLVHGSNANPKLWGYVQDENDAIENFIYQSTKVCFHGHTHVPKVFVDDGDTVVQEPIDYLELQPGLKYFINVGSVGQPRDGDPRAAYCVYDFKPGGESVELVRLDYDIETTKQKILEKGLPSRLATRLDHGK